MKDVLDAVRGVGSEHGKRRTERSLDPVDTVVASINGLRAGIGAICIAWVAAYGKGCAGKSVTVFVFLVIVAGGGTSIG